MKSKKGIELSSSTIETLIKDLGLLVVSMDHIGSTYGNDSMRRAIELEKYFSAVKAFKILAQARARLSEAYESQSSRADVQKLEESAENLPYWKPAKK